MIATAAVYRTADPEILARYEARLAADEERKARQLELIAELGYPEAKLFGTRLFDGGFAIRGFTWPTDRPAPDGWRIPANGMHRIEPKRTTQAGKEINQRLHDLSTQGGKLGLGMVDSVSGPEENANGTFERYWFGLTRVDDTLWVHWACDPDTDRYGSAERIDPRWEKVPLSEYFVLVEAGQDPFAEAKEAAAS